VSNGTVFRSSPLRPTVTPGVRTRRACARRRSHSLGMFAMDTASLDDFMALNDQITALIRAQVPTGLELGSSGDQAAGTLEKINAAVARRVSRGESRADAIGDEPTAPAAYRSVMQAGWRSGNVQQALDNSSRLAEAAE